MLEPADQSLNRPGGRVAQCADGVALDAAGDFFEHGDLPHVRFTCLDLLQQRLHPAGTLATRRALATRLVAVEVRQSPDGCNHVDRFVHYGHRGRSQSRSGLLEVVEVHHDVLAVILIQDGHRGTSWDNGLEIAPTPSHTTAVLFQQFPEGDAHLLLDHHGVVHMTRDTEQLGARVVGSAHACKPACASTKNGRGYCHRLYIGNRGRAAEKTDVGRKRWLQTRLALAALQRFNQRSLFATDVCTSASV
mmetsp:Transcript_32617/g.54989  ORF Transcript_32617/g.54989 Transcript_32617/m.54989 type:complete len:248 (-) Transcript_32617:558-1301(-)